MDRFTFRRAVKCLDFACETRRFKYATVGLQADDEQCPLCGHYSTGNVGKWQQCFGLRDKNGRIIYEGDILEMLKKSDPQVEQLTVIYTEGSLGVIRDSIFYSFYDLRWLEPEDVEIVGNVDGVKL